MISRNFLLLIINEIETIAKRGPRGVGLAPGERKGVYSLISAILQYSQFILLILPNGLLG